MQYYDNRYRQWQQSPRTLAEQARDLTRYDLTDRVRQGDYVPQVLREFVIYCEQHPAEYDTWQAAWDNWYTRRLVPSTAKVRAFAEALGFTAKKISREDWIIRQSANGHMPKAAEIEAAIRTHLCKTFAVVGSIETLDSKSGAYAAVQIVFGA